MAFATVAEQAPWVVDKPTVSRRLASLHRGLGTGIHKGHEGLGLTWLSGSIKLAIGLAFKLNAHALVHWSIWKSVLT
jgi:hypothetical protein